MPSVDFDAIRMMVLLPLALLPLLKRSRDFVSFPQINWLPEDSTGKIVHWLWKLFAVLAIASVVLGLARPGRSETTIERIGRGAELSILLDRSSSMDALIRRNAPKPGEQAQHSRSKNDEIREAVSWLLKQRPDNRYALTIFNAAAMRVSPFTDDVAIIQAGLDASDIGRGPNETKMGKALLTAIEGFDDRSYTGSRAILLVSDGGAKLDNEIKQQIQIGLERNKIRLYFIFIQSDANSPNLELVGVDADATRDEVALHVFFAGLNTQYNVFQADDPKSMSAAIAHIDQQQNLPLTYYERVPRIDYSYICYALALLFCVLLLTIALSTMERLE